MLTRRELPGRILKIALESGRRGTRERLDDCSADDWLALWEDLEHSIRRTAHVRADLGYGGSWAKAELCRLLSEGSEAVRSAAAVEGTAWFLSSSPYRRSPEALRWLVERLDDTTYRMYAGADTANEALRDLLRAACASFGAPPEVLDIVATPGGPGENPRRRPPSRPLASAFATRPGEGSTCEP